MITIRLMRKEDADAVRQVDVAAFSAWWRHLKGESAEQPQGQNNGDQVCEFIVRFDERLG